MEQEAFNKEFCRIADMDIYCEYDLNSRPPIVLLHGLLASGFTFNRLMPLLRQHFSVITLDLPGFGRSEKSGSFVYSYDNYARFILHCADYFNLDRFYLAGHSLGGQIALNTVRLLPDRIKGVVLLGSSGYLNKSKKLLVYSSYLPFFHRLLSLYIRKRGVKAGLESVFYDHSLITEEHMEEFGYPLTDTNLYKALIRLLRHREGDLTSDQLKTIHVPALILWGKEDKVVPVRIGHRLAADLPHAVMHTFNRTGHLLTEERPEEVCDAIVSRYGG